MQASRVAKNCFAATFALLLVPPFLPTTELAVYSSAALAAVSLLWLGRSWRGGGTWRWAAATLAVFAVGEAASLAAGAAQMVGLEQQLVRYLTGGAYVIGLIWCVSLVDRASRRHESRRRALAKTLPQDLADDGTTRIWNPLDPAAWYYGRHRSKLNQSIALLGVYSLAFVIASVLISLAYAKGESYELPGGGGGGGAGGGDQQQMAMAQTVRLKKVVKKKFVINPFSAIKMGVAEIDDVKLQLQQETDHLYKVGSGQGGAGSGKGKGFGYGDGDGSGFGNGTGMGKVRFIRLEYGGGDWNQDFGVGADLNMLIEYGIRTEQKVSDHTESRTVDQLASFPIDKSPPLVYLTGQGNIILSKSEIKSLRGYLLDKHGMLFGDNGGSRHFHNQFFNLMRQVLPDCEPVKVPLDDQIHRVPFSLPFLPYVAPHGGKEAWGWKVDGRWVCYYHPGDIGDAWSDGHSGVPREVWDACYRLGVNVIFYAHVEYSKWLMARQKR